MSRAFFAQFRIFIQQQAVHREFWLQTVIEVILPVSIPLLVWLAVIKSGGDVGGFSDFEIGKYYLLTIIIATLAHTGVHNDLSTFVHQGTLSQWLLRPIVFGSTITALVFSRITFLLFPASLALVLGLLLNFSTSDEFFNVNVLLTAFMVIPLGITVACFMNVLIGLIAFWFIEIEGIYAGTILILGFFSGMVVPVSLLPKALQGFGAFLPYHYVYAAPIGAISSPTSGIIFQTILGQLAWISILAFALALTWKKGLRRFDAVGG